MQSHSKENFPQLVGLKCIHWEAMTQMHQLGQNIGWSCHRLECCVYKGNVQGDQGEGVEICVKPVAHIQAWKVQQCVQGSPKLKRYMCTSWLHSQQWWCTSDTRHAESGQHPLLKYIGPGNRLLLGRKLYPCRCVFKGLA